MVTNLTLAWHHGVLVEEPAPAADAPILAADSWFVSDGHSRALALHRSRFFSAVGTVTPALDLDGFWAAAIAAVPASGQWFPRVELAAPDGVARLALRLRPAPPRSRSIVVLTHHGPDPRRNPSVKGPDLGAMAALRGQAMQRGADEAVITAPDGCVVEGATTALLWWRGNTLCAPAPEFERVDSVTAKTIVTVAAARGTAVRYEAVRPRGLDGLELWAVNALHGIRIITAWLDGPRPAAEPGRLGAWRASLDALSRPLLPSRT
jgi:hypothetical protein